MFELTNNPIDQEQMRRGIVSPEGGALVEFAGTVRNSNRDRAVTALEYEGAEVLARKEFDKIETEARASFSILRLNCVHRTGRLAPGETAVWIGVTALHRDAAFAACQFAINQLKKRLPIWKKEHYADGDSGWINAP